jgi:hypothetical protein
MIRPFTLSARTLHQLETIESKDSCCLTAPRMAFGQKSIAHLSPQWVCRTSRLHAGNFIAAKDTSFSPNGDIQSSFKTHSAGILHRFSPIHF